MKKINLIILLIIPLSIFSLNTKYHKNVENFITLVKNRDFKTIGKNAWYPIPRRYPTPDITDNNEFMLRYNEILMKI